jgi:hypothetical protein
MIDLPTLHRPDVARALAAQAEIWARESRFGDWLATVVPSASAAALDEMTRIAKQCFGEGYFKGVHAQDDGLAEGLPGAWMLHTSSQPGDPSRWAVARILWSDEAGYLVEHGDGDWREHIEASDPGLIATGTREAMAGLRATFELRFAEHARAHKAAIDEAARIRAEMHRDMAAYLDRSRPLPAPRPAAKPGLTVHHGGKA